mmetsp:Transcript_21472/g.36146  ORF Transcript_21472/g.36146 Transcript_21472/m.36146 type:complete len:1579 (-) Transcript_21472:190-4926(-)|eukprot:CAMPEP_0114423700 /NCGR_PEP_ID=MMETSP0103-20121206/6294_1 /TAXON_ID=37642 ORGANISM="Paraphysomonas imperforata, Strain PA2" /NCGR_SAMPLE_ID=MMETSP0103 /ASSEMBLY_ACC=CAM_ASM_000201 /LENGTH=1578 /DNA_ID=CAMNT_0001592391 /DNA_START=49 /DNA_END=4785 /DNA_ORIENTATION=+
MSDSLNKSQKLFSEYSRGDPVLIASAYELEQFFECYGGNNTGLSAAEIANQIGNIAWIPNNDELQSWDGKLPVILPTGQVVTLPFAALGEVPGVKSGTTSNGIVEEPDSDEDIDMPVVRDRVSEYGMVQNFAAETIQGTYRRYRDCKPAKKLKRVNSTDKLVMDMAADTIRTNIIRSNSRKKMRASRSGRPPLSVSSLDQTSLASSTATSAAPVKRDDELNFDIISRSSTLPPEDDDSGSSQFEKLVQGEKVESVILSPRSSQAYDSSPRQSPWSPRADVQLSNLSPVSNPVKVSRDTPKVISIDDDTSTTKAEVVAEEEKVEVVEDQKLESCKLERPLYVEISNMKAKSLKSVKWNGNNDPYVVLSIGNWSDETDVVWSAAENFTWPATHVVGVCDSQDISNMLVTVYNANLIRDDQMIGVGEVCLDSLPQDTSQDIEVDIRREGGKQEFRGTIVVSLVVSSQVKPTTSHCNIHHEGKKEKMAEAGRILEASYAKEQQPVETPQLNDRGGESTKKLQRKPSSSKSTDSLKKERKASTRVEPEVQTAPRKVEKRDPSTSKQRASFRQPQSSKYDHAYKSSVKVPGMPSVNPAVHRKVAEKESTKQLHDNSLPIECEDRTDIDHIDVTMKDTKKTKSSKKKKNHMKKEKNDLSNSEFIGNKVDVSPDINRIIDKAFQSAILEESSAIRLNTYETALVLNALNIELSAPPTDFISTTTATPAVDDVPDDISFRSGRSSLSSTKETVLLSLQSPPLLAAALSEFVREKGIVKRNMKSSRPFTLTEQQAIVASNHLISLVRGNWKLVRKIMLTASTNKGVSSEDNRPEYWGPHWMSKITSALQMPPLHLPENCGEDMINLTEKSVHKLVKPSILRTRCRLYAKMMKYLNEWWGEGSKPQDPLTNGNPEYDDDVPMKSKRSREILDGDYVKIAKSESLLKAMRPLQRAYAWSASVEEMTYFCDIVGGMIGMTMKQPPYGPKGMKAQGMRWVTFREDATLANSNISVLASLREFGDSVEFIAGRCVYLPQVCLKKHTAPIPDDSALFTTKVTNLPINNLINCEVKVGMKVKVLDLDSLYRAYERFDWWDRPSNAAMTSMAGRPGVIVSLPAPAGTDYKRYGVSILTKRGDEIIDALPPDAMEDSSVVVAPASPVYKSRAAPSNQVVNNNIVKPKTKIEVQLPDHRKPTTISIRNESSFVNPIPDKPIPYVKLDAEYADALTSGFPDLDAIPEKDDSVTFMDFPTGGDEHLPPSDNGAMTFDEIDEQIRRDARVKELDDMHTGRVPRPLYRPVTPSGISKNTRDEVKVNKFTSSVPRGQVTETYSDTNNYGWMKKAEDKSEDYENYTNNEEVKSVEKPKKHELRPKSAGTGRRHHSPNRPQSGRHVKMQTAELDPALQSSPDDNNIPRFQRNINKSRARAEKEAIRKQRQKYDEDVEDNIVFFEGSDEAIDFGITGLGFTGAKASLEAAESPKRYPKRPSSANKALRSAIKPKSAANSINSQRKKSPVERSKRSSTPEKDEFFVKSSKHHVPSPADSVEYRSERDKKFLHRELKKTEKEFQAKEQSLVHQLKSLGITVQDLDISR